MRVCRAYGATAPTLPCAGLNIPAPTHTFTDTNLIPSTQYTYAVFAYNTAGRERRVGHRDDPGGARTWERHRAEHLVGVGQLDHVNWTNPGDTSFAGVLICVALGTTAPTTPCGGVTLAKPTNTFTDTYQVYPGTTYSFTVFALDSSRRPGQRDERHGHDDVELDRAECFGPAHSHSMVPGGLDVTSRTTRLTSRTSLVMRVEIRSSTS